MEKVQKRRKKIDLLKLAGDYKLTIPELAEMFCYSRSHFIDMIKHPERVPVDDKLRYAIEAHLLLDDSQIAKFKKSRIRPRRNKPSN